MLRNGERIGRSKSLETLGLVLTLSASLWIYRGAFRSLFIQDDFAWLVLSRFHSFAEWARCFVRFNPAGTYRPLTQETFFWLGQACFGMWPPGFHVFGLASHLGAAALLYALLRKFFAPVPSLTGVFCYAIHGAHVTSRYWLSAFPEPLAMVFILGGILFFIEFDRKYDLRAYALSVAAMLLGLMSKESILALPLVLAAYCLLLARKRILWTTPYFALAGIYMLLRIVGPVQVSPYDISIGMQTFANLATYLSWMGGFIGNPFPASWGLEMTRSYAWIAAAFLLAILVLFLIAREKRVAGFALLWMAAALQPFLYFADHNYPYYLAPALAGLSMLIAAALPSPKRITDWRRCLPALLLGGLCLWLAQGTIRTEGGWWIQRTAARSRFVDQLLDIDRQVPDGETALIFGLRQGDFEMLEGGGVFKAYGLSSRKIRFMLPELDPNLAATGRRLSANDGPAPVHCFVLSGGRVEDCSEPFHKDPAKFLSPHAASFREVPGVRLEASPAIIRRGVDALVIHLVNLQSRTIDILYSIDGQLMPPALEWHLDPQYSIRIFADMTTPEGIYQFEAIRPSGGDNSSWIKVDARLTVR